MLSEGVIVKITMFKMYPIDWLITKIPNSIDHIVYPLNTLLFLCL